MSNIFDLEPEMQELIHRFEDADNKNSLLYFDVDDLESIIDCYIALEDLPNARRALDYAFHVHPNSVEIKCKEGKLLLCEGHYRSAANLLSSIPDLSSDYIAILAECNLRMRHFNKARDMFNHYLTTCDTNDLDKVFVDIATLFNTYKKPSIALEFLDNAVILFPDNKEVLVERAFAFEQLTKYDEAIDIYNKILASDPYSAEIWSLLGSMYFAKKDFQNAIRSYDYALAIHPNDLNTKLQRAHCLFNTGQFAEAVEPYREYIEHNPYDLLVLTFLAETYENIEDIENAEVLYKRVVDATDEIPEAWLGLAECYRNSNRTWDAYQTAKKANKRIPDNQQIVYYLSRIESDVAEMKDDDKYLKSALRHMLFCLKNEPNNEIIIFETGTLFLQFSNFSKAKQLFELAYEINPYIDNLTIFMAMAYFGVGDYDRCKKFYNKAKKTISNAESIFLSLFPEAYNVIK